MMKQNLSLLVALTAAALVVNFQNAAAQNTAPYWSLAGNSNASATSKLGTTNNTPLRLFTNNGERLRIDPSGKVGIGTASPVGKLTVFNNGSVPGGSWVTSGAPVFTSFGEATGGNADHVLGMASNIRTARPNIIGRRARGTLASPLAVIENDFITSFQASGYDGSAFQNPANIDFFVDGTPSAGNVPVRISLTTGSNAFNRRERLEVGSTGNFTFNDNQLFLDKATGNIGVGTLTPAYKLDVGGPGSFTNSRASGYGLIAKGPEGGLYGAPIDVDEYRHGTGVGVFGEGRIGVKAYGDTGLIASGNIGKDGSDGGIGIYARAGKGGVAIEADGTSSCEAAIKATGDFVGLKVSGHDAAILAEGFVYGLHVTNVSYMGVRVNGGDYGVYGTGGSAGIYGGGGGYYGYAGEFHNDNGTGLYAETKSNQHYAGYFNGNVYASGIFQTSDKTLKQNVREMDNAMSILNKLKPRNYEFKTDGKLASLHLPKGTHYGLIAQDVQEVLPNLVKETSHNLNRQKPLEFDSISRSGKIAPTELRKLNRDSAAKDMITIKAVNYTELIPIMIKGMQEQDAENKQLKEELSGLKERLATLEALMTKQNTNNVSLSSAYLEQSSPNPVRGTTIIRYQVPASSASARLTITNSKGQLIKTISITNKGAGQVNFNTAMLAAGTYSYTLWVDGKQADTKRLVVLR